MEYKVKWSEKSKDDFIDIIEYLIDNWGKNLAIKFKKTVLNTIEIISKMPLIFPKSEYKADIRRCVVVKQVSMYYLINEKDNEIFIVRFYNNRKKPNFISDILNVTD